MNRRNRTHGIRRCSTRRLHQTTRRRPRLTGGSGSRSFSQLPDDVIGETASFLPHSSFAALRRTGKTARAATRHGMNKRLAEYPSEPPTHVLRNGTKEWRNSQGQLHRMMDLPAVIRNNGTQEWWKNDQLHREGDLPAIIHYNGAKEWYIRGKEHRDGDQPAIIHPNAQYWYTNGSLHRAGNLPAYVGADGSREWWDYGNWVRFEPPP